MKEEKDGDVLNNRKSRRKNNLKRGNRFTARGIVGRGGEAGRKRAKKHEEPQLRVVPARRRLSKKKLQFLTEGRHPTHSSTEPKPKHWEGGKPSRRRGKEKVKRKEKEVRGGGRTWLKNCFQAKSNRSKANTLYRREIFARQTEGFKKRHNGNSTSTGEKAIYQTEKNTQK